MKIIRRTAGILALLMIIPLLAACGSEGNAPAGGTTAAGNAGTEPADETTTAELYPAPEKKDFDGYQFRFNLNIKSENSFWAPEEMNGDLLSDAIYERNRTVEENYNVKISELEVADNQTIIQKNVQAGDDFCDIFLTRYRYFFPLAQQGFLHDWYDFDEVRVEMPWWDDRIAEQLSINNKLYMINGDISTNDDLSMLVLKYNKKVYQDGGFENPYELVNSGAWTFDTFWRMVTATSRDLNGDGVMNENDLWGFITEYSALYYFYTGAGYPSIQKIGGEYKLTIGEEKTYNIIEKILVIGTEKKTHSLVCDDGTLKGDYDTGKAMFNNNQGLFGAGQLRGMTQMRDVESDYGALPIPKYTEAQDGYYNLVSWNDLPPAMPITVSDGHRTALILEALAYESYNSVTDLFFNVFLDEKAMRDEESKQMLDIIFDSKTYDLDWYATVTGLSDVLGNIGRTGSNTFVSDYAAIETSANAKLQEFVEKFAG